MLKHYVIATRFVRFEKSKKPSVMEGECVSSHTSEFAADEMARKLSGRAGGIGTPAFVVIPSEEPLEKGQIYPEHLAAWKEADYEERAVDLMRRVILFELGDDSINMDFVVLRLEDMNLSLEALREQYEEKARGLIEAMQRRTQEIAASKAKQAAIKAQIQSTRQEITYSFPAVRGVQAGKEYYTAQIPYKTLVKLFVFDEEDQVPAELRAQRSLNERRAEAISEYLIANPESYVLPAITVSVSEEMVFEPSEVPGASDRVGMLHIPVHASVIINDGQHRRRGIEMAIAKNAALKDETLCVTLFFDQGLRRSQQMFADINTKQVKPSGSINALYDQRNPFNAWTLRVLAKVPDIKARIDFENASPGKRSSKLWSLIAFKRFLMNFTGVTERNICERTEQQLEVLEGAVADFFNHVSANLPTWHAMIESRIPAWEVRDDFVIGHAVFLEALGLFGAKLIEGVAIDEVDWGRMASLSQVDPGKASPMWQNRCVVLGKMQKTADGVKSTAAQLFALADIALSSEMADLDERIRGMAA